MSQRPSGLSRPIVDDDDFAVVDDDDDNDEEEVRVLSQQQQRRAHSTPASQQPQTATAAASTCSTTKASPQQQRGTEPSQLANALRKIEAQQRVITALSTSRDDAVAIVTSLQATIAQLQASPQATQTSSATVLRNASYLEDVLGLVNATGAAATNGNDSVPEKARKLRESLRPVCVFHVTQSAPPTSATTMAASSSSVMGNEHEVEVLTRQVERLEEALESARSDNTKLADLYRDAQRREKEQTSGGGGTGISESKLAEELARVHEVLSESTATWDAKQRELQRLRTLMRFSVLRKENEHLHGAAQRADELEIALSQQQRAVKEKQYEVERLERHVERLLAEARERRAPTAELKRLRLLESHVLGIIAAQERDSIFVKGAHNNTSASTFLGLSHELSLPNASTSTSTGARPSSAGRSGGSTVMVVNGSPRNKELTASMQQYRLKGLIPSHLLPTDAPVPANTAAQQTAPRVVVTTAKPQPPLPAVPSSNAGSNSSSAHDSAPQRRDDPKAPLTGAVPYSAPPVATRAVVMSEARPASAVANATASAASPATADVTPVDERPMSDAETPFSVIAARMAKYLAKKEEEKKRKQEEAAAAAAKEASEASARQQATITPSQAGHKARLQNAFSAAASAGLPTSHRSMGYFSTDRACDNALKRQYDELRSRLDVVHLQGTPTATGVLGASRPSSAPVARRPTSGSHRRIF